MTLFLRPHNVLQMCHTTFKLYDVTLEQKIKNGVSVKLFYPLPCNSYNYTLCFKAASESAELFLVYFMRKIFKNYYVETNNDFGLFVTLMIVFLRYAWHS